MFVPLGLKDLVSLTHTLDEHLDHWAIFTSNEDW